MPNASSERVKLLCSWAGKYYEPGWIIDVGSAGADDPFLLREVRKHLRADQNLLASDIALEGLRKAGSGADWQVVGCDLHRTPFADGAISGVLFAEVLEHLYRPLDALRELARVLRKGGVLLMSTPNPFAAARAWSWWYSQSRPWTKANLALSIGNRENEERIEGKAHMQLYDPLSLGNLITDAGFRVEEMVTTNLVRPFSPRRQPLLWLMWLYLTRAPSGSWRGIPRSRLGVYTVLRAVRA